MSATTQANCFRVSDALWNEIEPLLPTRVNTHPTGGGRPRRPDRECFDAIYFLLRTGCQWNALDATGICPSSTAHDRFQQWVEEGFFERLWDAGLLAYDEMRGIDWSFVCLDGAQTKAPLGGEKNRPKSD
jgi:putative transposase